MMTVRGTMVFLSIFFSVALASAQNTPCEFDTAKLAFKGTPVKQARCLLRPNGIGGVLGAPLERLPKSLESRIGRRFDLRLASIASYLERGNIDAQAVGGSLNPIPRPTSTSLGRTTIRYFVIHDTSHPYLGDGPFPDGFDSDPSWRGNDLSIWTSQPVAHVFVNRLGQSLTTTPFDEPVRKGFGTKFARDVLKTGEKWRQVHIELVQPRRRDSKDPNPGNDRIAPMPGFTAAQYERLALLYLMASARDGRWLIPAYHSAMDAGIKDAHDDPQNFDLSAFARALDLLVVSLRQNR